METTEWDWPTAHQQHDLGETADVLWPSVRPNQRARIGPHPPAVDVASSNFIGIRNPSGSSTYFAINLYPQSGRLYAFLSYFDFDKVANCKEVNRNFVEGIEVVGDEAVLTYTIPMPSDGVTSESA